MAKTQTTIKQEPKFLTASDVAAILEVSEATAYRRIAEMNQELKEQGKIIVRGKISRRFFEEKVCI
jgi:transcriptional antiterminator